MVQCLNCSCGLPCNIHAFPVDLNQERAPADRDPMSRSLPPDRIYFVIGKVLNDQCPKCDGELDTGWECNSCSFDCKPIVEHIRAIRNHAHEC